MLALLGALMLIVGVVAIAAGIIVSMIAFPTIGDPPTQRVGLRNLVIGILLILGGFAVYFLGACFLAAGMVA